MSSYPTPVSAFDDDGAEENYSQGNVDCQFVTGAAGTGKTYQLRKQIEADPMSMILCATTGVAAVNLSTTTLNSVLGYFDTESLADSFVTGKLVRRMVELAKIYKKIAIDEVSMMPAEQLDIITLAAIKANERLSGSHSIGIVLTGDFAQLSPIKAKWAFEASNWHRYAANTTKLTKIWRQDDQPFLDALNLARAGQANEAAEALRPLAKWTAGVDTNFVGTTIVSKNDEVDKINSLRYMTLKGKEKRFRANRWGQQKGEWKIIPEAITLKVGAYVMILSNGRDQGRLIYANGDQGTIQEFSEGGIFVKLDRTGETHLIPYVERLVTQKDEPDTEARFDEVTRELVTGYRAMPDGFVPYLDDEKERYVLGGIMYLPVRLAYAATVHKTQGLTLDNVQIDPRGHFFGSPNMAYVALSRVKSPKGLKIVGTPEMLARRIQIAKEVLPWV